MNSQRSNGRSSLDRAAPGRSTPRAHALESTSLWRRVPPQLVAGVALIACFWPIAWGSVPLLSQNAFFPLWLGYVLTIDGLVYLLTGTSLLTRGSTRFVWLFVFSSPVWWLFEAANQALGNWQYISPAPVSGLHDFVVASIDFSTVIPAVFGTAELTRALLRRTGWSGRFVLIAPSRRGLVLISASGFIILALSLLFPHVAFALVWIGAFLALDPINRLIGARSIAAEVARNDWRAVAALMLGGFVCGFFWEMWNFYSMPKWIYRVPYVGHPKLFEMPVLGYGGYLPFALELFALYNLAAWLVTRNAEEYVLPRKQPAHIQRSANSEVVAGRDAPLL